MKNKEFRKLSKKQRARIYNKQHYDKGWNDGLTEGLISSVYPNSTIKKLFWRIYYIKIR